MVIKKYGWVVWIAPICLFTILSGCGPGRAVGPSRRPAVNVIVAKVQQKPVSETIDLVGSLASNERVELSSEISGIVSEINFKEGDRVDKKQLLLTLDDRKLKARFAEAEADFVLASTNRERSKNLLQTNTVSEQSYDQAVGAYEATAATLELRKRELEDANITAPFDGIIGYRRVSPGQFIQAGQPLSVLVNINPIKADFDVPERFIGVLEAGQDINITVAAYPHRTFSGKVYFISPEVDSSTRNVLVRANIPNQDGILKPGMFGNLRLVLKVRENALVIPESALIVQSNRSFVMAVDGENKAQMRTVTPGLRMDGAVEIVAGLNPGDTVITEGHQKIGPGSPVNPLPSEVAPAN